MCLEKNRLVKDFDIGFMNGPISATNTSRNSTLQNNEC